MIELGQVPASRRNEIRQLDTVRPRSRFRCNRDSFDARQVVLDRVVLYNEQLVIQVWLRVGQKNGLSNYTKLCKFYQLEATKVIVMKVESLGM